MKNTIVRNKTTGKLDVFNSVKKTMLAALASEKMISIDMLLEIINSQLEPKEQLTKKTVRRTVVDILWIAKHKGIDKQDRA